MGGKFKLLSLPCWGSQQPKLQNWNCKEWSRSPHSAPAHAPGGGCGGKGEGSKGARGWERTWSAHCRAFAAFARASKRTGVPGVSSFMTQPRTSSRRPTAYSYELLREGAFGGRCQRETASASRGALPSTQRP